MKINPALLEELSELKKCLELEKEAEREEFQEKILSHPIKERVTLGVTLWPIELEESDLTVGERWRLRFTYGGAGSDTRPAHRFRSGQVVTVFRDAERISGVLSRMESRRFTLVLDDFPDWLEEGKPGMDLDINEHTYQEMGAAIERLESLSEGPSYLLRNYFYGYDSPGFELLPESDIVPALPVARENLNAAQIKAVAGIARVGDFALVHGPPGTGKTTTLVAAIEEAVAGGLSTLVSTSTNAAADHLAECLLARGLAALRLGHPARVNEKLLSSTLDGRFESDERSKAIRKLRREAQEIHRKARRYHRHYGRAEARERQALYREYRELNKTIRDMERGLTDSIIENSNPILTTLVGARAAPLGDRVFDLCIIDEATQALAPAAWIPILRAKRLVMAGDHRQLPPTVKSESPVLKKTLFEKAMELYDSQDWAGNRVFFLDTQYRMEEEILGFSNVEFYDGRLKSHESLALRTPLESDFFQKKIVFIDTAGCDFNDVSDEQGDSRSNPEEAALLLRLYRDIVETRGEEISDVGIIATYKSQANLLFELINKLNTETNSPVPVEVDTVDAFQGREKDMVLISLVRSNDSGETGFLSDTRRMNVAMTRAKRLLIIVGDSATISYLPFYERFLDYVQKNGAYHSAYEFPD